MKTFAISLALFVGASVGMTAQSYSHSSNHLSTPTSNDITLSVDHVAYLDGPIGGIELNGFHVYNVYANIGENNFLNAIESWLPFEDLPGSTYSINTDSDCYVYENAYGGFLPEVPCFMLESFPEAQYDSYLTIGKRLMCDPGEVILQTVTPANIDPLNDHVANTEITQGRINCPLGSPNGWADSEGKVLVAQVTSCGNLEFQACFRILPGGINDEAYYSCAEVTFNPEFGCTDFAADNYNLQANVDDGSCIGNSSGCIDPQACNFDPEAEVDNGSCIEPSCTDVNACNYSADAACYDDDFCVFMIPLAIQGENDVFTEQSYTYSAIPVVSTSEYTWEVTGGEIVSGQGTSEVEVVWALTSPHLLYVQETNIYGCEGPNTGVFINANEFVNIREQQTESWSIYPNPARDQFQIQGVSETTNVYCFDATGKLQFTGIGTSFSTHSLSNGIYILKIRSDEKEITKRLIVSKEG